MQSFTAGNENLSTEDVPSQLKAPWRLHAEGSFAQHCVGLAVPKVVMFDARSKTSDSQRLEKTADPNNSKATEIKDSEACRTRD